MELQTVKSQRKKTRSVDRQLNEFTKIISFNDWENEIDKIENSELKEYRDYREELLAKIFSNDLIFDKIANYLNFEDIKSLSLTSYLLLIKSRGHKRFSENLKLIISKESFEKKFFKRTNFIWRTVDIELSCLPKKTFKNIRRIMKSVEQLEIYEAYPTEDLVLFKKNKCEMIKNILIHSVEMKTLIIDCNILQYDLSEILKNEKMMNIISKLEKLEIRCGRSTNTKVIEAFKGLSSHFAQNTLLISQIRPMNLKSFGIHKVDSAGDPLEFMHWIPKIIQPNCENLEELILHFNVWHLEEMKNIFCPKLKSLSLSCLEHCKNILQEFLRKHQNLETLNIQLKYGFPKSIIDLISINSQYLKKLVIKAACFCNTSDNIQWDFLHNIQNLQYFEFFQPTAFITANETQTTCFSILKSLPDKIVSINLRGLDGGWPNEFTSNFLQCFKRFDCLTELSLVRCEQAVNDEVMQFICSNNKRLRVLKFSHCYNLTNYGLSGVKGFCKENINSEISVRNLKGLKTFSLKECPGVTYECLSDLISFKDLRYLELAIRTTDSIFAFISKPLILKIAEQNPSLETLILNYNKNEVHIDELKKLNPRIKSLELLTRDWSLNDSDSDAALLDEEEDEDDDSLFSDSDLEPWNLNGIDSDSSGENIFIPDPEMGPLNANI